MARTSQAPVYSTADLFVDQCLRQDGSLFTPGEPIWSAFNIEDFYDRFVANADEGTGSFWEKLKVQLAGAPDAVVQLAAEAVFFNYLCEDDTGAAHKRSTVDQVLSWMQSPVAVPPELDTAFAHGIARIGLAKTQKWQQLSFLVRFIKAWKSLSETERTEALRDPAVFRERVHEVEKLSASVQIEGLLHLVFPDFYEDIVSPNVKAVIAKTFADVTDASNGNVDERLAAIRDVLGEEFGENFSFYDPGVVAIWGGGNDKGAWLVRGADAYGANIIPEWLERGIVSMSQPSDGEVRPGTQWDEMMHLFEQTLGKPRSQLRNAGVVTRRFVDKMAVGDWVLTVDPSNGVYIGEIAGGPEWDSTAGPGFARWRRVDWLNVDAPVSRDELQPSVRRLFRQNTVIDLSAVADEIAALVGEDAAETETDDPIAELAASVWMAPNDVRRLISLIERKRQAIFYGPPGTGKTYVALKLARFIAGDPGRVRLVQFHASYSYEDFVEGFRPTVVDGQPGFRISEGPLRILAHAAENRPDERFVLVIDEINRGNVAKVFGELYFLLEYREEHAILQYSADAFRLPPNLLVIGTMNTADRTIAILDAALRRRFFFIPFFPDKPPVSDLLRRWLRAKKPDLLWVADVVDRANEQLADGHVAIGHSFFIDDDLDETRVRETWEHAILPTIEEHYFGQPEKAAAFTLDRLLASPSDSASADQPRDDGA